MTKIEPLIRRALIVAVAVAFVCFVAVACYRLGYANGLEDGAIAERKQRSDSPSGGHIIRVGPSERNGSDFGEPPAKGKF